MVRDLSDLRDDDEAAAAEQAAQVSRHKSNLVWSFQRYVLAKLLKPAPY